MEAKTPQDKTEDKTDNKAERCPECGAEWQDSLTCREHFHQMLAWDHEDAGGAGAVHHLTVLCYNLQHPSVYSPESLDHAKILLRRFLEQGAQPEQVRRQNKSKMDSGKRTGKITGTPEAEGAYAHPVHWTMTAPDVTAGGLADYCTRVQAWSRSVLEALQSSGNMPA